MKKIKKLKKDLYCICDKDNVCGFHFKPDTLDTGYHIDYGKSDTECKCGKGNLNPNCPLHTREYFEHIQVSQPSPKCKCAGNVHNAGCKNCNKLCWFSSIQKSEEAKTESWEERFEDFIIEAQVTTQVEPRLLNADMVKQFISEEREKVRSEARKECKELNFDHYIAGHYEHLVEVERHQAKQSLREELTEKVEKLRTVDTGHGEYIPREEVLEIIKKS